MSISRADFIAMQARTLRHQVVSSSGGTDSESKLHAEILEECNRRNWIPFHSRMDRPSTLMRGAPDFFILADGGAVILVECKTKSGKVTTEQLAVIAWAKSLGHTVHIVRCISEFRTLCKS